MKKYNVSVSPSANDRMYDHFLFLSKVSEKAAHDLLTQLINDIQSLEFTPEINPYLDRPYIEKRKYRYKLSYRRYRIVYQIINNDVIVDDIQDCRQNDDKYLL
ncbi:MAG: type II toxin-antitoxin system RelE/ParE family toxin [Treponema sp.]|nr:type II toxin-antitoxin system RelE/ParE family toxin [Treponema sp.]